jgi:pimeloyl-ACP methyl ester carboxylesterase
MQSGEPKIWCLIRGLSRESAHWLDLPEKLQKAFPQDRVITLDSPGVGYRLGDTFPLSINRVVPMVRADAERKLGHQLKNVILFGTSLGGMICTSWKFHYPDEIIGMALINSSNSTLSPMFQRLKPSALVQLINIAFTLAPSKRQQKILNLVTNLKSRDPGILEAFTKIQIERPPLTTTLLRQLFAAGTFTPEIAPSKTPVLILGSAKDRMVSYECSVRLAERFQGTLKTHPEGGHELNVDDPDWVVNEIRTWATASFN